MAATTASPFQQITQPEPAACCTPATAAVTEPTLHEELSTLLANYDINAAAASVKVYALKPVNS
jgi:hypothetical protein